MPTLTTPPGLEAPTTRVRESYLAGERADRLHLGTPTDSLDRAAADFETFVAERAEVRVRWGVPATILWYVAGEDYLGTLVIRHRLTPELAEAGGHIGYHVVLPWRRRGHATRMLAAGLARCAALGLDRVLLTCTPDNVASHAVITANGGLPDGRACGEDRFWIDIP